MPSLGREVAMKLIQSNAVRELVKKCPVCGSLQHVRNQSVQDGGCSICSCPVGHILAGTRPIQVGGMVCR